MTRHRLTGRTASVLGALALIAACSPGSQTAATPPAAPPVDHQAVDDSAIHAADTAWLNGLAAKDTTRVMKLYANDALTLLPGSPLLAGKDETRKSWATQMAASGFAMTFRPIKTVSAGDMAYEVGDYQFNGRTKGGQTMNSKGKYVVVWARQPDGSWKVLVDAPTTTQ
jgi:uncharacterized protein (TIGR02246 family)